MRRERWIAGRQGAISLLRRWPNLCSVVVRWIDQIVEWLDRKRHMDPFMEIFLATPGRTLGHLIQARLRSDHALILLLMFILSIRTPSKQYQPMSAGGVQILSPGLQMEIGSPSLNMKVRVVKFTKCI